MLFKTTIIFLVGLTTICESAMMPKNYYSIGGGISPNGGGTNYNNGGGTGYNGIGGGVSPGGSYNPGTNTGSGQVGSICTSSSSCRSGLSCIMTTVNGVSICQSGTGGNNNYPSSGSTCTTSSHCQSGTTCVITNNGQGTCQVYAGGYVGGMVRYPSSPSNVVVDIYLAKNGPEDGKLNSACERDADCEAELFCTLYFGEMICRQPIKPLIPLRCETESDCPSSDYLCVFSTAMQDRVCYKYGDTVTDGYVIPIKHKVAMLTSTTSTTTTTQRSTTTEGSEKGEEEGMFAESRAVFENSPQKRSQDSEVPKAPIYMKMRDIEPVVISTSLDEAQGQGEMKNSTATSPAGNLKVMVNDEPIDPAASLCEFDYHCRMGESCSGNVRFVDRNVTVCRYDILKKNRQCIYHSDCLSGQRCISKLLKNDVATCEADISATLGSIQCFYDYQCSGGEKCVLVDEKQHKYACRPPTTTDPRSNQLCTTNAQCPFQQVCRQSAGIFMCIDISLSQNPSLLQEKVLQFFRHFIVKH